MSDPNDIIHCELCDLSHRRKALRCDRCDHELGTTPDWSALRAELPGLRRNMARSGAAVVAMLALNMTLFGGAGYIVLLAPLGWFTDSVMRHRNVSGQLRRAPPGPTP